jgi:hypothetical protein
MRDNGCSRLANKVSQASNDGENLSKAVTTQHTAEYIDSLEQDIPRASKGGNVVVRKE